VDVVLPIAQDLAASSIAVVAAAALSMAVAGEMVVLLMVDSEMAVVFGITNQPLL
jgi:hypothetical protein